MYDAESGLILTAGGAPNYHYYAPNMPWPNWPPSVPDPRGVKDSTNNDFVIKLEDPGADFNVNPVVKRTKSMKYQRAFANGVTLPNGETFVVGGQLQGEPFFEKTWHDTPEIWNPGTGEWRVAAPHSTPRVYHSFALLLPDATVLVGGGGLSSDDESNHFDAQIYHPPYLLTEEVKDIPAEQRPKINSVTPESVKVGQTITFTTEGGIDTASLVRYSGVTHSLNNDQRRIVLKWTKVSAAEFKYNAVIPLDTGVALPGYWMLFVLANKVPSEAKNVQILLS